VLSLFRVWATINCRCWCGWASRLVAWLSLTSAAWQRLHRHTLTRTWQEKSGLSLGVHPVVSLTPLEVTVGIGLAVAVDLARKGWKLSIVDINTIPGEDLVVKLGEENAMFIMADVSKWEDCVKFFKLTKERFGRVDFGKLCTSSSR
jgi:short chain dehydrogenase